MARKRLGEVLVEMGLISEARLKAALDHQQRFGGKLGRILMEMKFLSEAHLIQVLANHLHVPIANLDETAEIHKDILALIPGEYAEAHAVVPFALQGKFLEVAMADPTDLHTIDDLQARTRLNVHSHLAGPSSVERAIARFYQRGIAAVARDTKTTQPLPPKVGAQSLDLAPTAEMEALRAEVDELKAHIARDEDVLRQLLTLLIEKGVLTIEEWTQRMKKG